jgi:FAD/FMN-containing dehydrogenase
VKSLPASFGGKVVTAQSPDFSAAAATVYGGFDLTPAAVAYATDANDVAVAVRHASEHGIKLAVRGGGHSPAGHSLTDGGLVLDLSALNAITIDPDARTATAGAGLTAGAYAAATAEHGLATGFGDTGTVSIGGITLAGGAGFLTRSYGLTIDNLLRAQVVTANGDIVEASITEHPDLFWAIRGGGGNFGVVTELTYRLHPLKQVTGGLLALPATAHAMREFAQAADAAPRSLSTICSVMVAPPMPFLPTELHGKPVMLAFMCDSGDLDLADEVYRPFREVGEVLADMIAPIPYPQMFPPEGANEGPAPVVALSTAMTDSIDEIADDVVELIAEPLGAMRAFQFRVLGGAVQDVAPDATAYSHRDRLIMANAVIVTGDSAELPQAWARAEGLLDGLTDRGGCYPGFLAANDDASRQRVYNADAWAKLRRIKREYDAANLFSRNHNITPAA